LTPLHIIGFVLSLNVLVFFSVGELHGGHAAAMMMTATVIDAAMMKEPKTLNIVAVTVSRGCVLVGGHHWHCLIQCCHVGYVVGIFVVSQPQFCFILSFNLVL
jgi:hypothetical protein